MKTYLNSYTLLIVLFFFGCKDKGQIFTSDPVVLPNERISQHILLPSTNIFLAPIKKYGYLNLDRKPGIQSMDDSWELWTEISNKSMDIYTKTYGVENLEKLGVGEILEQFKVNHNGVDGFYVSYVGRKKQIINYRMYLPEGKLIRIIAGNSHVDTPFQVKEQIKSSILEFYIGTDKEIEEVKFLAKTVLDKKNNIYFNFDEEFDFAGRLDLYYYFSKDGEYPTHSSDSAWFAIRPRLAVNPKIFKDEIFKELLGEGFKIIKTKKLDGLKSAEIWFAQDRNKKVTAFAGFKWSNRWTQGLDLVIGSFQGDIQKNMKDYEKFVYKVRRL